MMSLKPHLATRLAALACIWASVRAVSTFALGQEWKTQVGAQSQNKGRQVLAFLSNEFWIRAGDPIALMIATDEPHMVTFLKLKQVRLPFAVGCPRATVAVDWPKE